MFLHPPQKVVPWGVSCWADTGDAAEGWRGPHSTPYRTHHTPVQGFSGCLCSFLHPRTQSPKLWVQRGAQTEAPCQARTQINGHIYGQANRHTTKSSTILLSKKKSMETKRSPLIASVRTGRQQTALSLDISTWHMHAFLKRFSLHPGSNR